MKRKAIGTNLYYPEEFVKLDEFITTCFTGSRGPGDLPTGKGQEVRAILVPSDTYALSGPVAAWGYKALAESETPETFIILAPALGSATTSTCNEDWETPFGTVACDIKLVKAVLAEGIELNNRQHSMEHAIEIQLPLLQFSKRKDLAKLRILPLLIGSEPVEEIIKKIEKALGKEPRRVKWIIAANITHYGPGYHYIPFEGEVQKRLEKQDKEMIALLEKPEELQSYAKQKMSTFYGLSATLIVTYFVGKSSLIRYEQSGEVTNEWKNVVSYAAITFS